MKKLAARILSIGIVLVGVAAVQAQSNGVTADVPFNFHVGSSVMPQGPYWVDQLSHGAALRLSSTQSGADKSIVTISLNGKSWNEPARLVFHRYGEEYFLAEVWMGGSARGQALTVSPAEKELARSGMPRTIAMVKIALH